MKKFKIYTLTAEYIVLKCPHCQNVFRYDYRDKRFGQKVSNASCQRCEKKFNVEDNSLNEDNLSMPWGEKEFIMITPEGNQKFITNNKKEIQTGFESADNLSSQK